MAKGMDSLISKVPSRLFGNIFHTDTLPAPKCFSWRWAGGAQWMFKKRWQPRVMFPTLGSKDFFPGILKFSMRIWCLWNRFLRSSRALSSREKQSWSCPLISRGGKMMGWKEGWGEGCAGPQEAACLGSYLSSWRYRTGAVPAQPLPFPCLL